jgi:hypothetical protein
MSPAAREARQEEETMKNFELVIAGGALERELVGGRSR